MDSVCGLEIPLVVVNDELVEVNWGPADRNAKCTIVDVNVVDSWLGRVLRRSLGMKNRWSRRRLLESRWKWRSIQWDWCWRWVLDGELSVFLFVMDSSPVVVCLLFFVAIYRRCPSSQLHRSFGVRCEGPWYRRSGNWVGALSERVSRCPAPIACVSLESSCLWR